MASGAQPGARKVDRSWLPCSVEAMLLFAVCFFRARFPAGAVRRGVWDRLDGELDQRWVSGEAEKPSARNSG